MNPGKESVTKNLELLKKAEQTLSPPQLTDFKRLHMQQYRRKNILLASALFLGVASVYGFSMYKTGKDDFKALDNMENKRE